MKKDYLLSTIESNRTCLNFAPWRVGAIRARLVLGRRLTAIRVFGYEAVGLQVGVASRQVMRERVARAVYPEVLGRRVLFVQLLDVVHVERVMKHRVVVLH